MNSIRQLRLQAGVTQKELALAAGTSQPTVAAYEAGTKSPTLDTLQKLAKSLGVDVAISFVPSMTREDLRSLAYHRAITKKLRANPAMVLAKAKRNLSIISKMHPGPKKLFDLWNQWLNLSVDDLAICCLDSSVLARDMRQVTPFAGVLTASERLNVIRSFRKETK